MRVLIVDDEPAARRRLQALLEALDVVVVGEAGDGVAALQAIGRPQPDVVLLDIAMPEVDGFEVVRHAPEPKPLIIFQTAYNEYALKAFEHDALDYVVKPVTRARLEQALERAQKRIQETTRRTITNDMLARLESAFGQGRPRRSRVLVRHGSGHRALPLRDVTRFVAEEGVVYAVATAARYLTDYTLSDLEERLSGLFVRTSRAELVNMDRIDRIASNGDGSATLTLTDGATLHVSRRRAADVRRALQM